MVTSASATLRCRRIAWLLVLLKKHEALTRHSATITWHISAALDPPLTTGTRAKPIRSKCFWSLKCHLRIKPDVAAPGSYIYSAHSSGTTTDQTCDILKMRGTSMATPVTAGNAALIRQYFEVRLLLDDMRVGLQQPCEHHITGCCILERQLQCCIRHYLRRVQSHGHLGEGLAHQLG